MSKKMVFLIALIVGIAAGLLGVTLGDWVIAPRDTKVAVESAPVGVMLSEEAWERLEKVLDGSWDNWP